MDYVRAYEGGVSWYDLVLADGVEADSELVSVSFLLPSSSPDHVLSAPRGERQPAKLTHPRDCAKGLCM